MKHAQHLLLAVLLWLGFVFFAGSAAPRPAHAASGQNGYPPGTTAIFAQGYYPDSQTTQPWRGPLTVADTTALTAVNLATFTVANGGRIKVNGRPNCPLSVRFSNGAGTTCAVAFVALWTDSGGDHVLGVSEVTTLTATQFTDPQGRSMATTLLSDSYGASDGVWLLVTAPSGGSVYFDPGTY